MVKHFGITSELQWPSLRQEIELLPWSACLGAQSNLIVKPAGTRVLFHSLKCDKGQHGPLHRLFVQ